eukprot:s2317_g10.t1
MEMARDSMLNSLHQSRSSQSSNSVRVLGQEMTRITKHFRKLTLGHLHFAVTKKIVNVMNVMCTRNQKKHIGHERPIS